MATKNIYLILLGILLLCAYTVSADTGTYVINHQYTDLTITNSSDVVIAYDVDFAVTGGNIPWVTTGLPTSNYAIITHGGAIKSISPYNSGGWSGVRMDLDRTYYPGESFKYQFSVVQHKFVSMNNGRQSIQITPNWWDNAVIKDMKVTYHIMMNTTDVKTSDSQAIFNNDNTVTWRFPDVPKGVKHTVGISLPSDLFPMVTSIPSSDPSTETTPPGFSDLLLWGSLAGVTIFFIIIAAAVFGGGSSGSGDDYVEPKLYLNTGLSGKKVTRNLHLNCLRDSTLMTEKKIKDITIDLCLLCGALFFDRGEIEKLLKAGVTESEFNPKKEGSIKSLTPPESAHDVMASSVQKRSQKTSILQQSSIARTVVGFGLKEGSIPTFWKYSNFNGKN
jgi:Zn-finger nucleic acid-binding protein